MLTVDRRIDKENPKYQNLLTGNIPSQEIIQEVLDSIETMANTLDKQASKQASKQAQLQMGKTYGNRKILPHLRDAASIFGIRTGWYIENEKYETALRGITSSDIIEFAMGKTDAIRRNREPESDGEYP